MPKLTYLPLPGEDYILVLHDADEVSPWATAAMADFVKKFEGCVGMLCFSEEIEVGP